MRVVFIGTGEIGVPTLQSLLRSTEHQLIGVVTQPDKPSGRTQTVAATPIKKALEKAAVPILQPRRIKSADLVEQVRAWTPDAIVVMAYGQILPRALLDIPQIACLNLHASLLPRHRGAAPIQAAIVAGDRETGITVIYMDEGLDTGDILLQSAVEISNGETGGSLHDRLAQIAPLALKEALRQLDDQTAPRTPQDSAVATYAPKLERADGKIDWSDSADVIERKIRAFNPWPGAFTNLSPESGTTRKLKLFSATVVDQQQRGSPGEIVLADDRDLVVAAKDGTLSLGEVQLEGRRRMTAVEFLRGFAKPLRIATDTG
jgi:methionyl-tRNA formyltransferase